MRVLPQAGVGGRHRVVRGRLRVSTVSLAALGVSIVLHLVLWFGFRVRPTAIHPLAYEPPGIVYQPSPDELGSVAALRLKSQTLLQDPTLLSLPHPRGFSRETMDRWTAALRRSPEWGWRDAALPAPSVSSEPRPILPAIPPSALAAARIRPPAARPEEIDIGRDRPGWPREVVCRFLPPHTGLEIVEPAIFPALPGATPERAARLRVGFDAGGRLRHAVLAGRTGDANVDEAILDGLRRLRIARPDGGAPAATFWAMIEILWPIGLETQAVDEGGAPSGAAGADAGAGASTGTPPPDAARTGASAPGEVAP